MRQKRTVAEECCPASLVMVEAGFLQAGCDRGRSDSGRLADGGWGRCVGILSQSTQRGFTNNTAYPLCLSGKWSKVLVHFRLIASAVRLRLWIGLGRGGGGRQPERKVQEHKRDGMGDVDEVFIGLPNTSKAFLGFQNGVDLLLVQSRVPFSEFAHDGRCQACTLRRNK